MVKGRKVFFFVFLFLEYFLVFSNFLSFKIISIINVYIYIYVCVCVTYKFCLLNLNHDVANNERADREGQIKSTNPHLYLC